MNNRRERSPRLYELLHRSSYRNYDLVICQSRYMRDDLVSNYNFPHIKTVVINNPIDIEAGLKEEGSPGRIVELTPISQKRSNNKIKNRLGKLKRGERGFDLLIRELLRF